MLLLSGPVASETDSALQHHEEAHISVRLPSFRANRLVLFRFDYIADEQRLHCLTQRTRIVLPIVVSLSLAQSLASLSAARMSSISSLPPELLSLILSHIPPTSSSYIITLRLFLPLSLVARSWIEPGQRALCSLVLLFGLKEVEKFLRCLEERKKRTGEKLRVGKMVVKGAVRREVVERLLEGGMVVVDELTLGDELVVSYQSLCASRTSFIVLHKQQDPTLTALRRRPIARPPLRRASPTSHHTPTILPTPIPSSNQHRLYHIISSLPP